ncbi:(d)CMP kinase [Mollicutes bacterium LVI A0039]|nr:(d)CMP kinase [Mollicutes bacterium LVI A0039]
MIIALDGPAGSGKSTIAKQLAKELKFEYLDTGAMYRAMTLFLLQNEVDLSDSQAVANAIVDVIIDIDGKQTMLNGVDVSKDIRGENINKNISVVAANATVRDVLVKSQRLIGSRKDMILDGRDIGTVVFPNADFKFYIDASSDIRAKRRVMQNKRLGIIESFETIKASIENRDEMDRNREIGPLKCAEDAIVIDTSNINLKQTIAMIKKEMEK